MGKFRIRVKVQGFELEVDGDREDIPAITSAVQRQLGGMIQPSDFSDSVPSFSPKEPITIESSNLKNRRAPRKRSPSGRSGEESGTAQLVDFRHDSGKYGSPKQAWTVGQKCVWLLFVVEGIKSLKELTASQITSTYNSQFKAAGKLHPPHVPRELNSFKVASPALVGEDKGSWFLTDEGQSAARTLVKEGLGQV